MPITDPTDLSNLEFWFRGDLGTTVTSGRVTDWADQSGSGGGRDLTTGGNTATHPIENTVDGFDTVQFDGSNDQIADTAFTTSISQGDFTLIIVAQDNGDGSTANQTWFRGRIPFTFVHEWVTDGSGNLDMTAFVQSGATAAVTLPIVASGLGWYMLECDNTTSLDAENSDGDTATDAAIGTVRDTFGWMTFGSGNGSNFSPIDVAEIIYYSDVKTGGDRTDLIDYLNDRYFGSGALDIQPNLLASASTFFNPTITTGAVDIAANLLTSDSTFFQPTVTTLTDIQANLLTSTSTFFEPTVDVGAANIDAALLASDSTFFNPTVDVGAVDIQANLLASTSTIHEPTVTAGGSLIQANLLASASVLHEPTIATGAVNIDANLLTSASVIHEPIVSVGVQIIQANLLASTSLFHEPTINVGATNIDAALLTSQSTFFEPTVSPGAVDIQPNLLTSTSQFFLATVDVQVAQNISANILTSESVFHNSLIYEPSDDPLTYTAALSNGDPLPEWLTFTPLAKTFWGTPPSTQTLDVRVTASDGELSADDVFTITVT